MITVKAPVRVDLAGGWSDVPDFADEYGGAVLNAAVTRYAEVRARRKRDSVRLEAADLGTALEVDVGATLTYDGSLDLHKAALKLVPLSGGVEIISRTEAPPGSGLGASGALDVALVSALARLADRALDAAELAELAFQLEAVELGLAGGRQDQYAAAHGGFLHLEFGWDGVSVTRLDLPADLVRELELSLVIGYTGQTHFSPDTHKRVWQRFHGGEVEVVDAIRVMKELVKPASEALMTGAWRELAQLVDENWRQQQRLDKTIATDVTRAAESAAKGAGAWGAKAAGAGAGGCMLFIGPPERRSDVMRAIRNAGGTVLDYRFDQQGVRVLE